MSNHLLDRHFHRSLHDQTADVPAGLWEAVQSKIPPQPKGRRRTPVFWFIFGFSALVLLAVAITTSNKQSPQEEAASLSIMPTAAVSSTPDGRASNNVAHADADVDVSDASVTGDITPAVIKETVPASNQPALAQTASGGGGSPATINEDLENPGGSTLPATAMATESQRNAGEEQPTRVTESTEDLSAAGSTRLINIALLKPVASLTDYTSEFNIIPTDCYSFGKSGHGNILLDVYAGPSFATKSMSSRNENVSDYIMGRDTTEFSRVGLHIGVRAGYQHPSGFFARIGAQYTQLNERFDYVNGSSTQTIITTDTIFDAMGNIVDIIPDTVVTSGTRVKKTYNRFHTVDIPILLGYQVENGDWAYGLQAGPVFNIAFSQKGDILAPNGVPGSFSDTQSNDYHPVFKDQLGLSVYGAFYAQKRVGEFLYAFVEPHVLHRLKSITLDSYPIDQRQTAIGLSLGLRLKL